MSATTVLQSTKAHKRKREPDTKAVTSESKKPSKAAKRRKSKKPKDVHEDALDTAAGVNDDVAHMDSPMLADYIAQRTKRFNPELSLVELEDLHIPERAIRETSSTSAAVQRTGANLPSFLNSLYTEETLKTAPSTTGSPHTIILSPSGQRAADLVRPLRVYQHKDGKVEKLFAKHIKLAEAITSCQNDRINVGVGTPQRVADLLENGALKTAELRRLVIDASFIDIKKRGILDMKDVQPQLVRLLIRKELREKYGQENGVEIVFY